MNLRPPGYEPGELPDCSTPRRATSIAVPGATASSMRPVTTAIWVGLGIFCIAVAAGTAWVGYQLVRSWRQLRELPRLVDELGRLNRNVSDVERRVASVQLQISDLQRQADSLSVTLARARVLMGAVNEVRSAVDSVRTFLPTK